MVTVYEYNPARGRSYTPTPPALASKKAIVNVQKTDNTCCMWSILAALYPPKDNAQRVMKYRDHAGKLKCGILELSINIYKYDPKYRAAALRISENQSRDKVVDLLLLDDKDGNTHYTWLKNISHLIHGGIGHTHHHKRFICKRCLTGFKTTAQVEKHKVICTDKRFIQRCVFPTEDNKILRFKSYTNKW